VLPTNHIRSTDHVILTPLEDHLQPDTSEGNLVSEIETFLSHLDDSSTSKTNDLEINFENPDDLLMEFLITNKEPSEVTVPVNQEIKIDGDVTLDLIEDFDLSLIKFDSKEVMTMTSEAQYRRRWSD